MSAIASSRRAITQAKEEYTISAIASRANINQGRERNINKKKLFIL